MEKVVWWWRCFNRAAEKRPIEILEFLRIENSISHIPDWLKKKKKKILKEKNQEEEEKYWLIIKKKEYTAEENQCYDIFFSSV